MKTTNIILIILAAIVLFWCGYSYHGNSVTYHERIDTVKVLIKPDSIYLDSVHTDIIYRYKTKFDTINNKWIDTVYRTLPFIAKIDTATANNDSISLQYWFPEQIIKNLRVKPHSFNYDIVVRHDTVRAVEDVKWYEKALYFVGGVGVGIISGAVIWK